MCNTQVSCKAPYICRETFKTKIITHILITSIRLTERGDGGGERGGGKYGGEGRGEEAKEVIIYLGLFV